MHPRLSIFSTLLMTLAGAAGVSGQTQQSFFDPEPPSRSLGPWEFGLEYLYWFFQRDRVPPLLTGGDPASGGVLGQPGTALLYGDGELNSRHRRFVGVRPTLRYWLTPEHDLGIEGRAALVERDSSVFTIKPTAAFLARPYLTPDSTPAAEIISGPSADAPARLGSINLYQRIEVFSQEVQVIRLLVEQDGYRLEALAGLRCQQMRNRLDITATGRELPDLTTLHAVADHFQTFNKYAGGQLGLRLRAGWDRWSLQSQATLSGGGNAQQIRTKARRLVQTPNGSDDRPLGLYVQPSNLGNFERTVWDGTFEWNVELACQFNSWCRGRVGYTFQYWHNPVRSGDQIETVNTNQLLGPDYAGPAVPQIPFRTREFWLHGWSIGLEMNW